MILPAPALAALLLTAAPGPVNVAAVPGAGPYFALTFDAHVEANGAARLLALLRERHIRATIFVTGRFAETHPELLRQAADDGHEVGNHTFSHPHLTTWATNHRHDTLPQITRARLQDELLRTAAAIAAATGRPPSRFWRAPYGEHNPTIRAWAAELGLVHVDWTHGDHDALDALDWVENPGSRRYLGPEAMARHLLDFEATTGVPLAGSIMLMHLGNSRPDLPLLEALPLVLDETDLRGLHAVGVGELLRRGGVSLPPDPRSSGDPAAR
ncbi:MAG: polysaccharide deacetylase family protein [Thermoanaerobaculaceae bacterium]|nr:polysaccharide deacetylase family protein [Thermoanaerobaculaceae bacterium]TAM44942.1 MAG: polysaccharide deacetylase family protein [Acidobacteriota bacterium]